LVELRSTKIEDKMNEFTPGEFRTYGHASAHQLIPVNPSRVCKQIIEPQQISLSINEKLGTLIAPISRSQRLLKCRLTLFSRNGMKSESWGKKIRSEGIAGRDGSGLTPSPKIGPGLRLFTI
jgi:hypothetical protein